MKKRPERKQTFSVILGRVAARNASRSMERAALANRLAKTVGEPSRGRAYLVKTYALVNLRKSFPEQILVSHDLRTPRFVLIRSGAARFRLHAPAQQFVRTNL